MLFRSITEEEYCKFAAEVRRKGVVRPAEYEHLPDVRNEVTTAVLINLAISLVLTGVAYLLTPKPKMPEASKRSQLDLGSVNAGNRFLLHRVIKKPKNRKSYTKHTDTKKTKMENYSSRMFEAVSDTPENSVLRSK